MQSGIICERNSKMATDVGIVMDTYRDNRLEARVNDIAKCFDATGSMCLEQAATYGKDLYPFGGINFVNSYFGAVCRDIDYMNHSALEIPSCLRTPEFLGRRYFLGDPTKTRPILSDSKTYFIKDASMHHYGYTLTYGSSIFTTFNTSAIVISEALDFRSEWRAYVLNGMVVQLACYRHSNNFSVPSLKCINDMIAAYDDAPKAYTLDVGVTVGGTYLIEIHNFVACGLYTSQWGIELLEMIRHGAEWEYTHRNYTHELGTGTFEVRKTLKSELS